VLLGLGWNFMFVGATTLLTTAYRPAEKAKVQGINDLVIFLVMMTSSAASGALVSTTGWLDLNLFAAPAVGLATLALLWLMVQQRRPSLAT
jgi:predicted MFS family arabinose efflux permease